MVRTRHAHHLDSRALRSRRISLSHEAALSKSSSLPASRDSRSRRSKQHRESRKSVVSEHQTAVPSPSQLRSMGATPASDEARAAHIDESEGDSSAHSGGAEHVAVLTDSAGLPSRSQRPSRATTTQDPPAEPQDAGLPADGFWDHDNAYDRRFCFDHGETEYLLGTPNRWMLPDDFGTQNAETRLAELLHEHTPCEFDPHSKGSQAECGARLLSHVHQVLRKSSFQGSEWYLIQWKACWTPKSSIDDKSWLAGSMAANRRRQARRSARLEGTFEERESGYRKMMLVIAIE